LRDGDPDVVGSDKGYCQRANSTCNGWGIDSSSNTIILEVIFFNIYGFEQR
jgi:hypothetical protein